VLTKARTGTYHESDESNPNPDELLLKININTLKLKRERVRKDSIRVEEKRKHPGESERRFISEGEKEHLVRRYPGNARSSF
jgi:hypothetical protein